MLTLRSANDGSYYRAKALRDGTFTAQRLSNAPWTGAESVGGIGATPLALGELTTPVLPSKIVGIGQNYIHDPTRLGSRRPERPLLFLKPSSSLLTSGGTLVIPPFCDRVEYEVELGVVIGKRAQRVRREDALNHVFGYTVLCDITSRDLQPIDNQWTRAKGCDGFCPIGPAIVDAHNLDPSDLRLQLWQNGELRQDGSTAEMLFQIDELIEFITAGITLEPGDVISTGTPAGGAQLVPGDVLNMRAEGIPDLTFNVARG